MIIVADDYKWISRLYRAIRRKQIKVKNPVVNCKWKLTAESLIWTQL